MTFQNKVYWMDDTDPWVVKDKLAQIRKKYPDSDWVKFNDDVYETQVLAFKALVGLICEAPMFDPARIVYTYAMPFRKSSADLHPRLVKNFASIPDNVCLIIIARPDKQSILYKGVKALEAEKQGRAEEAFELSKTNAIDWITAQAAKIKLAIDKQSCMMLADATDFSPSSIQNELIKLRSVAPDGVVSPRIVQMSACSPLRADVKELGQFILNHNEESSHEYLQRLLELGEPPIKICGYLQDWVRKLALAESAQCNYEVLRVEVAELKKWKASNDDDGDSKYETVDDEKWGKFVRRKGETVPMFANPKALYYSCDELHRSGNKPGWAYDAMDRMFDLQMVLRSDDADKNKAMHNYVADLMSGAKKEADDGGDND